MLHASITGKQADGEKFLDRINGNDKPVVCLYVQASEPQQTVATAEQAIDQELPF